MSTDNMGFDAEIGIVVKGAKDAISTLEDLRGVSAELDKQIDRMQRSLAGAVSGIEKVSGAASGGVAGIKAQSTALQGLIRQYNSLQRASVAAVAARGPVGSAAALGTQKAKELETARLEQKRFNDYVTASNARINAAELKSVQDTQKAVRKEREETARQAVRTAKEQQNAAFASYASNMPNALKAAQTAAMDSYAANIAYTRSNEQLTNSLSNTRYALYDVASTLGVISAATLGVAVATEGVGIAFERDFANVARTSGATGSALQELNQDLVAISTSMPLAFSDVTAIATLGGQLGIAKDQLDEFSSTVGQFAATTNVTTEAAATGFGRLAQLTDRTTETFDQYASAVYQVGINSVATEQQILNVAQQIAVSGNLAGFTADQIIGLSGALASLGVQPESARGSIMRIFNEITVAAEDGGEALNKFASISGMAAGDFADKWRTSPQAAFTAFIDGLGAAGQRGENLMGILGELGIVAVRDARAIQLLADNTDVYSRALTDAETAFGAGTALGEGYAITAETTAARLQRLANTLMAVAAAAGNLTVVKAAVDLLQDLADAVLEFVDTPIGGFVSATVLGFATIAGAAAAVGAAIALSRAAAIAWITANNNLSQMGSQSGGVIRLLAREMGLLSAVTTRATVTQNAFNTSVGAGSGRIAATAAATRALAGSFAALASSTGVGLAIVGSIAAISKGVDIVSDSMRSSAQIAEDYFGDLSGLSTAIEADTTAFNETGQAIRTVSREVRTSSQELAPWASSLQAATGAQVGLTGSTETTTNTVRDQTIAIGENARAWVASKLANDEAFQAMYQNQELLDRIGFNTGQFANAVLGSEDGGVEYLRGLIDAYGQAQAASEGFHNAQAEGGLKSAAIVGEYKDLLDTAQALDASMSSQTAAMDIQKAIMGDLGGSAEAAAGAMDDLGESTVDAADALVDMVNAQYEITGGTVAVQNALASLGESLAVNGNNFSAFSESGRLNLAALQAVINAMASASGGDAAALATNIAGLMQSLGSFGVNAANDLLFLQNILNGLTGGRGTAGLPGVAQAATQANTALGQGFTRGATKAATAARKAGKAADKAAQEIRTLSDYSRDLGSVFDNAFELRFSVSNTQDAITEIYAEIAESAEDAAKAARDAALAFEEANARINSLNADNRILEYQLTVANEYKDALRSAEILAEMGENNVKLAEAQEERAEAQNDLTKAQQTGSRTLVGDSQAARDNRDTVEGLVKAYQDQIVALANTGMSSQQLQAETARLKQQFITQLTQMGYNRAEVDRYAAAFDGLGRIIAQMPRNVTVTANVDPAQRAIEEFLARNANRSVGVTANLAGTGGNVGNFNAGIIGANRIDAGELISPVIRYRVGATGSPTQGMWAVMNTGGVAPEYHATGGVHGLHPGQPQGSDTTPAWLTPGEFVHRTAAVDYYGLPFMNALNNMQIPRYLATGTPVASASSGPSTMVVELSATDRALLAAAGNVSLSIDGRVLADTVTSQNTVYARRGAN